MVVTLAFLSVIPSGNLLLPVALPFALALPNCGTLALTERTPDLTLAKPLLKRIACKAASA